MHISKNLNYLHCILNVFMDFMDYLDKSAPVLMVTATINSGTFFFLNMGGVDFEPVGWHV